MRLAFLLLATLLLGAAPPPTDRTVDYALAPVMEGQAITALAVTMRLSADPSGVTNIGWPDEWAGETKLGQWARDIAVEGASAVEVKPNGARVVHSAPGAPLTVRYRIVSGFAGDPNVDNSRQPVPVVRPRWFYAVGNALFAVPDGDSTRAAQFHWTGAAGLGFASDLEHGNGATTLDGITESVVIGGRHLHVVTSGPADAKVRVARLGDYAFDTGAFDALVPKVIEAERRFWRERRPGPFLVTMAPVAPLPGRISYSGTGRGDAFALWIDTGAPADGLIWLLAHEYFHTWNAPRLGEPSTPHPLGYWFSEGFTDFYTRRLMLRAGLISADAFAEQWNDMLRRYAASPYRAAPNEAIAAKYWDDEDAEKMQYQRGALLAVGIDQRLRERGVPGGLDAVMRTQAARFAAAHDKPVATELFADTARRFGVDVRADIAAHVERGKPLLLGPDAFGACARVVTEERSVFARGWNAEATEAAGNVVTGLDPASPAYAAGLRNGMKLLARIAGTPDDARVDYVMRVSDAGVERVIRFRPTGAGKLSVQELVLDRVAFARAPDRCQAALAG